MNWEDPLLGSVNKSTINKEQTEGIDRKKWILKYILESKSFRMKN